MNRGQAQKRAVGLVKEMVGYHWLANFATLAAILILFAVGTLVRSETRPAT